MTWQEYIKQSAHKLAQCRNKLEFESVLAQIEQTLNKNSPPMGRAKFWGGVAQHYKDEPKLFLRESTAAADLNALLAAAETILQGKARGQ
jgi:hypothetical protein